MWNMFELLLALFAGSSAIFSLAILFGVWSPNPSSSRLPDRTEAILRARQTVLRAWRRRFAIVASLCMFALLAEVDKGRLGPWDALSVGGLWLDILGAWLLGSSLLETPRMMQTPRDDSHTEYAIQRFESTLGLLVLMVGFVLQLGGSTRSFVVTALALAALPALVYFIVREEREAAQGTLNPR